ncbi:hypothetical protein [Rubidibacter lacunae]|uniref:hypothetical protein n=1 Tax=Rubidibacter lacunae TaxID=582514 RepID=UPI000402E51D|nr:hypothetical protein [Rubidibacter lacunae]
MTIDRRSEERLRSPGLSERFGKIADGIWQFEVAASSRLEKGSMRAIAGARAMMLRAERARRSLTQRQSAGRLQQTQPHHGSCQAEAMVSKR